MRVIVIACGAVVQWANASRKLVRSLQAFFGVRTQSISVLAFIAHICGGGGIVILVLLAVRDGVNILRSLVAHLSI